MNVLTLMANLSEIQQRMVHFSANYVSDLPTNDFRLEALVNSNGVEVLNLVVLDRSGQPVDFNIEDQFLHIDAAEFQIEYDVQTRYEQCVGADRDVEMVYPFINANEIFLGTGVLAHPQNLPEIASNLEVAFQIENLPGGWTVYSNLPDGAISPAHVDGFFVYCSPMQAPAVYTFRGQHQIVTIRFLVQQGKALPFDLEPLWAFIEGYWEWLETHIAPYMRPNEINVLFLQAPDHFQELTGNRSFATGENFLNGIVTYGPTDAAYWQKFLGYRDYAFYLYDGLAHEIMHFYTSTSWQARYKSVLYPAPDCPPNDARLMGEALNLYFSRQYVYQHLYGSNERFLTESLVQELNRHRQRPRKNALLELFVFDIFLREAGSSLLALYSKIVQDTLQAPAPYSSAALLFDSLAQAGQGAIPDFYRTLLLDSSIPDYPALITAMLQKLGYTLVETGAGYQVEQTHDNLLKFELN